MKKVILLLIGLLTFLNGQNLPKEQNMQRIKKTPVINGLLEKGEWDCLPKLDNFVQFAPYNGAVASEKTEVWICYDDDAIYLGARLYDSEPLKIIKYVSQRDNVNPEINDMISLVISPFDDKNNSQGFMVSASNVQVDRKLLPGGKVDVSWDAVWQSATNVDSIGWTVEIRIPFSALRFPAKEVQDWGFNVWRRAVNKAEWSTWSYADNSKGNFFSHYGKLKGFTNIQPPLRLSFMPYISGYVENNVKKEWGRSYNVGMDLKYGINESFTLDMVLIPDFSQVQNDDQQLNLTPFEIQYNERRQFFTEGTELFNKGGIFYSRRIGSRPAKYNLVTGNLTSGESIEENPIETKLINATKISGRTKNGLGIGFFNALTNKAEARIINNSTKEIRNITTQSVTNYNMFVFDYLISDNSYISLANTNVLRKELTANVTAVDFKLAWDENNYELSGITSFSYRNNKSDIEKGYSLNLNAGKVNGEFKYSYGLSILSDNYNPNDMGYLQRNNEVKNLLRFDYNIYKPFGVFDLFYNTLTFNYSRLFNPDRFTNFNISYDLLARFKNQMMFSLRTVWQPVEEENYYEPREIGKKVHLYKKIYNYLNFSTDFRSKYSVSLSAFFNNSYDFVTKFSSAGFSVAPTVKINNQINLSHEFYYDNIYNDAGFVNKSAGNIYFGERNVKTVSNTLTFNYMLDNELNFSVRTRHYWSEAKYDNYYILSPAGKLTETQYDGNHDQNFNTFSIDAVIKWIFTQGSEISIVWKNSIFSNTQNIDQNYTSNLKNVFDSPQTNSVSVKFLYYIDYSSL